MKCSFKGMWFLCIFIIVMLIFSLVACGSTPDTGAAIANAEADLPSTGETISEPTQELANPQPTQPAPQPTAAVGPKLHFKMKDFKKQAGFLYRAPIQTPVSSAWGPDGLLYIADFLGRRIVTMTQEGEIRDFQLKIDEYNPFYDDGPRTLAFSPDGTLFVNTHNDIFYLDENNVPIKLKNASGAPLGAIAFSPDGDLYYSNRNGASGDVRRWKDGKSEFIVDKLPFAENMVIGLDGSLYVSQMDQGKVYKVNVETHEMSLFFSTNTNDPIYLAADKEGDIWVRGINYLTQLSPQGKEKPIIVDGTTYKGTKQNYLLQTSSGLTFDQNGAIWIASYNSYIVKFTPTNPSAAETEYTSSAVYPGLYFSNLAVNSNGELFGIEQFSGELFKITEGNVQSIAKTGCSGSNGGLAISQDDTIFVSNCGKIMKMNAQGSFSDYAPINSQRMVFGKDGALYAIAGSFNEPKSLVKITGQDQYTTLATSLDGIPMENRYISIAALREGLYVYYQQGNYLFKVDYDGQATQIPLQIEMSGNPVWMTANYDGEVFLIGHGPYELVAIDNEGKGKVVASSIMGDPWSFAWSPDQNWLYIGECGGVIKMEIK